MNGQAEGQAEKMISGKGQVERERNLNERTDNKERNIKDQ